MTDRSRDPAHPPSTTSRPTRLTETVPPDDASIPVLTERLTLPPLDLDLDFQLPPLPTAAPAEPAPAPPPSAPEEPAPSAPEVVPSWPQSEDLELRESILLAIARGLPLEVEDILRRHLDRAVQDATRRFSSAVRLAIAATLREIVERAVQAELDRVRKERADGRRPGGG